MRFVLKRNGTYHCPESRDVIVKMSGNPFPPSELYINDDLTGVDYSYYNPLLYIIVTGVCLVLTVCLPVIVAKVLLGICTLICGIYSIHIALELHKFKSGKYKVTILK